MHIVRHVTQHNDIWPTGIIGDSTLLTICINETQHDQTLDFCAERHVLFTVMLDVVMLSVVALSGLPVMVGVY